MAKQPFTKADLAKLAPGDHGAVVVPADCVTKPPAAIDLVSRREKVILGMARSPGFNAAKMADALKKSREIH